jgi:hypothetical protein
MSLKTSKTIHQAEKRALDGANESQDTLVIAHKLMMDFGVGLVSVAFPWRGTWPANPLLHCAAKQLTTRRRPIATPFTSARQTIQSEGQHEW